MIWFCISFLVYALMCFSFQLPNTEINGGLLAVFAVLHRQLKKDLRLLGYEHYPNLEFSFACSQGGDCLDRYLIRMNECLESLKAIQQCIKAL